MILRSILACALLASAALAAPQFTAPTAGQSITGSKLTVTWGDTSKDPATSDLSSYQLFLCAGGNTAGSYVDLVNLKTDGDFTEGNSITLTIPSTGLGASTKNAYFVRMLSTAKKGGTYINFSSRFTLSSMTGTFPAAVVTGLQGVSGTDGPAAIDQTAGSAAAAAAAAPTTVDDSNFALPYTMQTGAIRYAPMVPVPGTKITAKDISMQYQTSAYTVFKTYAPAPKITHTLTQEQTDTVISAENPATPASNPQDAAMQKYLNRWKD